MKPPQGLMAGMEDQEAVETAPTPDASDTRQADNQQAEQTDPGSDDGEPNVSPEEQAAYEEFVTTGLEAIYEGGKVKPGILELLDNDPADLIATLGQDIPELGERFNPTVALAATAVVVTLEIIERLPEKPDGEIIMHGGKAILEELADLANERGGDFTQEEINQAYLHAVDIYQATGTAAGTVDKELASQEFADILNAQDEGRLDEVVPGLEAGVGING